MIKNIKGNIFTTSCQTIVNTVNCVGVMGAGIALEFKYRYPDMFQKYVTHCKNGYIQIGKLWVYNIPNNDQKILNFPTKQDWKHQSKYTYLEKGLAKFVETYKDKNISSIAFPMLGALNGGLDPDKVSELMAKYLSDCDIPIEIYEYDGSASDDLIALFRSAILKTNINQLEATSGIKKVNLLKLRTILDENDLCNLISLTKIKGLGEETIKNCFQFAMKLKTKPEPVTLDIFSTENISIPDISYNPTQKMDTEINKPSVQSSMDIVPITNSQVVINSVINNSTKEKAKLTGLTLAKIAKIENKDPKITIEDLKCYCKGLNIDFNTFVAAQNYAN